ncbi:hypothetical protein L210DRAFT_2201980 [Boletus edulis BED1]|uniref:Uncharacterized protein n=1 Tax=Boletus edulis BED1 TaxID=1328754 RepID=A0AAD4G6R7_BOLED|nr:hypothetical protein L210DRAFT_2201980 [Boletus edulis BED1]
MGDTLVAAGVKPSSIYGATKVSPITCTFKSLAELALWDWVRFGPNQWVRWVAQGGWDVRVTSAGAFVSEASIGDMSVNNDVGSLYNAWGYNPTHQVPVENPPDVKGYATADVFIKHSTIEGLYKVVGRQKTVPAPMEMTRMIDLN